MRRGNRGGGGGLGRQVSIHVEIDTHYLIIFGKDVCSRLATAVCSEVSDQQASKGQVSESVESMQVENYRFDA